MNKLRRMSPHTRTKQVKCTFNKGAEKKISLCSPKSRSNALKSPQNILASRSGSSYSSSSSPDPRNTIQNSVANASSNINRKIMKVAVSLNTRCNTSTRVDKSFVNPFKRWKKFNHKNTPVATPILRFAPVSLENPLANNSHVERIPEKLSRKREACSISNHRKHSIRRSQKFSKEYAGNDSLPFLPACKRKIEETDEY